MRRAVFVLLATTIVASSQISRAHAEHDPSSKSCIETRYPAMIANYPGEARRLGIALDRVKDLTARIAKAIGLPKVPTIIECEYIGQVDAVYMTAGGRVPEGEYIVYSNKWVNAVVGNNEDQAIVLFGHELGHFLQKHFTDRERIPRVQKETEADKVAGCAVAKMGRPLSVLADVLSRIRADKETDYPARPASLRAAEQGFNACGGTVPTVSASPSLPTSRPTCGDYQVSGFRIVCDQLSWGSAPRDSPLGQMSFSVSSIQECASKCAPLRGCAGFAFDMNGSGSSKSCYTFGPGSRPTGTGKGWLSAFK